MAKMLLVTTAASLLLIAGCGDSASPGGTLDGGSTDGSAIVGDGAPSPDGALPDGAMPDGSTLDGALPGDAEALDAVSPGDGQPGDGGESLVCVPGMGAGEACGGDPVATWTYVAACTNEDFFTAVSTVCPGASASNTAYASSGTLAFNGDNSFVRDVDTTVTTDIAIPALCSEAVGGCSNIATGIEAAVAGSTATCSPLADGCSCTLSLPFATHDTGTYTVNGGLLTVAPSMGAPLSYRFCIEDTVLRYKGLGSNAIPAERLTYVLTKPPG